MDRDGRNVRLVTNTGVGANWAPFFTPDGTKIIYGSNARNPRGNNFDLFLINLDGTGLEQITSFDGFDGFPMFSPDGRKLVLGSNRNQAREGDTNVFMADWAGRKRVDAVTSASEMTGRTNRPATHFYLSETSRM